MGSRQEDSGRFLTKDLTLTEMWGPVATDSCRMIRRLLRKAVQQSLKREAGVLDGGGLRVEAPASDLKPQTSRFS